MCAVKGGVSCHHTSYLQFSRFNLSLFLRLHFFITHLTLPSTAVLRGSELEELCDKGEYVQLTERELIEEEKMLLRALKINDCIFFGSHPYNLITISGVLPQDREEIIKHLDSEMAAWDRDQPGFLDTVWKRTDM